jgi:RNA polymerase sigma-70 factor (family 1)
MAKALQELSDSELLQRCAKDDLRAFNILFDRYAPKLYKLGMRYLKDHSAVEELSMDLLYNIWERRHSLQVEGQLSAYLFRGMHNKSISHMRKTTPQMMDIESVPEKFLVVKSSEHDLLFRESENKFRRDLKRLSPQRRKVFELSRDHDLSYKRIAKELNLSLNTVENHMVAALSFLRKHYKENLSIILFLIFFLF